ncbi:MAG TPA: hypothetical protein PLW78_12985, partial [bacterium]|nr:hypothetical protein [bacterium]
MCFNRLFVLLTAFFVFLLVSCGKSEEKLKNDNNLNDSDVEKYEDDSNAGDSDITGDETVSESDETVNDDDAVIIIEKDKITGFVQKGPFINGTSISLFELDENLVQTGKIYNTQITKNDGIFELADV